MRSNWRTVLLVFAVVVSTPAVAKSIREEFTEAWTIRQERYAAEMDSAKEELKSNMQAFQTEKATDQEAAKMRIMGVFEKTRQMGYNAGRADVLVRLIAFIKSKPSSARAEMWFQEETDHAQQEAVKADERLTAARSAKIGEGGITPQQAFSEAGQAIFLLGTVQGTADELALVNSNLASFFQAKSAEDQRRRQAWANALGALGNSLQNSARQNESFMMSCNTVGQFTNCMGH